MPEDDDAKSPAWLRIVLAVITLVGVLAVGYWQFVYEPGGPEVKTVSYTGRVRDDSTNQPIHRAKVSVEEDQKVPQVQETDSEGIFHVNLPESAKEVRIVVEAVGYDSRDRRVSLTRTGLEDIRLTPSSRSFGISVPTNPTLGSVLEKLRVARNVKVDFGPSCGGKARRAVVEFNGGTLYGKDEVDFLRNVRARTNVNYEVKVIQPDSSYEIVCL
ncbi:MAG TPA: carboxypeptidase regulatory-like domain-containing protein [Pyrinomonadaceae bacterium]